MMMTTKVRNESVSFVTCDRKNGPTGRRPLLSLSPSVSVSRIKSDLKFLPVRNRLDRNRPDTTLFQKAELGRPFSKSAKRYIRSF